MKNLKSIAFLVCYFGDFPWYFDLFLHSCRYNPTIDFIIFSDTSYGHQLPDNVKLIHISLGMLNENASDILGFDTNIKNGYKLCDFKPAYGLIFERFLKDYDFWGHCDMDIIFGNIREFISDELLMFYDVISVRHDWLSGCFLVYKNSKKVNQLFMKSRDYQKVLSSDIHYCFDETNFAHDAFTSGLHYDNIQTEIDSMTHVVLRMTEQNHIKSFFDFFIIEGLPGNLEWIEGTLSFKGQFEVLFYHMIQLKKVFHGPLKISKQTKRFKISSKKVYGLRT